MKEMSEHGGRRGEIVGVSIAYFAWKLIDISEIWVERDPDFLPRIEGKIASFYKKFADLREWGEEMVKSSFTSQQAKQFVENTPSYIGGKMHKKTYNFFLRKHHSFPTEDW